MEEVCIFSLKKKSQMCLNEKVTQISAPFFLDGQRETIFLLMKGMNSEHMSTSN